MLWFKTVVITLFCLSWFEANCQTYDGCIDSGEKPRKEWLVCDNCNSNWKSGYLSLGVGLSLPVGDNQMTNYSKLGLKYSLSGGYYFKKNFGLGVSLTHHYNPIDAQALVLTDGFPYVETQYSDWKFKSTGHHVTAALLDFSIRVPFCNWQVDIVPQVGAALYINSRISSSALDGEEEHHAEWVVTRYPMGLVRPVIGLNVSGEYRVSKMSAISVSISYTYGLFYLDYWTDDYLETTNTYLGIGTGGEWSQPGLSHLGVEIGYSLYFCKR